MNHNEINPFQSPGTKESDAQKGELSVLRPLQAAQKSRRSWGMRCWLLGVTLVAFSVFVVALLDKFVDATAHVIPNHGTLWLWIGVALTCFIAGIICVVVGPISWYWFGQNQHNKPSR